MPRGAKRRVATVADVMGNIDDPDAREAVGCVACGGPYYLAEGGRLVCDCGEKPARWAGVFKVLKGRRDP
jgi:hypothetical protein